MSEGQRTTPYELKVPIDSSLMGFLSTGLPGPEICRIMNFDTSLVKKNKTNLFNLFQLLKKHYESIILTKPEVSATAPIVYPSANLAKVLNLLPNKRIHKQKIIIKLIEYIKENNLQHPAIWYKFKMNKFLNALRTNSPVDELFNENENNTDNTTNIPQTPLVLYRFDDLETIFESHFIDNKEISKSQLEYVKFLIELNENNELNTIISFLESLNNSINNEVDITILETIDVLNRFLNIDKKYVTNFNYDNILDQRAMPSYFLITNLNQHIEQINNMHLFMLATISMENKNWHELHPEHLLLLLKAYNAYDQGSLIKAIILEILSDLNVTK